MTPFKQLESLLEKSKVYVQRYAPELAEKEIPVLIERVQDARIRIMLFGAYNAGKSTLINALLGKEVAKVGDIPTTDRVDKYDWEGHVLLDTPGVNAPIAHERVAEEELARADLVLFLIRQEDQDADDVIRRLFSLLERNLPVFILLNYDSSDPALIAEVQNHLNDTLIRHAKSRGVSLEMIRNTPCLLINARTAMKARLGGKQILREHSGFDNFMLRFTEWLKQFESEKKRLESTQRVIDERLLKPTHTAISVRSQDGGELDGCSQKLDHFNRMFRVLSNSSRNKVSSELANRRPDIAGVFDSETDTQIVIARVTQIGESTADVVTAWLQKEFNSTLQTELVASLQMSGIEISPAKLESSNEYLDKAIDLAVGSLKNGATKESLSSLLKAGRSLKIPFLKGRWEKTLEKWAGKAAPVLQVVLGAWEIISAHRDQGKQNQQLLNHAMQRSQWVDDVLASIQSGIMESIDQTLDAAAATLLRPINEKKEQLSADAVGTERDLSEWNDLVSQFHRVRF